jgi:hypothetical protein
VSLREPDPGFVRQLEAYDKLLKVVWCEREPITGDLVQRWRILRKGSDGRDRHIMFVVGPKLEYRPLDNRVLEKLHRCDSHRFCSSEELIAAFDGVDELPELIEAKKAHERRYHEWAEEMGEKLMWAAKQYEIEGDEAGLQLALRQADAKAEVRAAYDRGKGKIVHSEKLGCPVVVPGSSS